MGKIHEIAAALGAGARNNKYRVKMSILGRELDILIHNITVAGRSVGTTEVFLKGRKYLIKGDRSDSGEITFSFYNEPGLVTRNTLLQNIEDINNYDIGGSIDTYQFELTVDQLDHKGNMDSSTVYKYAWVSSVSELEYQDEVGDISQTSVTITYTGSEVK